MDRVEQMKQIQQEALELFIKKNADYGDAFATFGVIGEDKIKRCISISSKNVQLVDDETLRDTLIDLHNYAAMALMLE
jgi:DNA-binding protein YbaB